MERLFESIGQEHLIDVTLGTECRRHSGLVMGVNVNPRGPIHHIKDPQQLRWFRETDQKSHRRRTNDRLGSFDTRVHRLAKEESSASTVAKIKSLVVDGPVLIGVESRLFVTSTSPALWPS